MRRSVVAAVLCAALSSCLTTANYQDTPQGRCTATGQYYEGFTVVTTDNRGVARCKVPQTEVEKCSLAAETEVAFASREHDAHYKWRNWLIGIGYVFWVVPGAAMYYVWKDDNAESFKQLQTTAINARSKCDSTAH